MTAYLDTRISCDSVPTYHPPNVLTGNKTGYVGPKVKRRDYVEFAVLADAETFKEYEAAHLKKEAEPMLFEVLYLK